jgi:hypothetical protein
VSNDHCNVKSNRNLVDYLTTTTYLIGGDRRFTLFEFYGNWQYEDPDGSDVEVRLQDGD